LAEKLRLEGHDKGKEAGFIEGKRETLKRLLAAKFGVLPPRVLESIDTLRSSEELDRYIDRVLTAATLSDLGLPE
jgi:hypothetical protein